MSRRRKNSYFNVGLKVITAPVSYVINTRKIQKEIEQENLRYLQELDDYYTQLEIEKEQAEQAMDEWVDSHPVMEIFRSDCGDVVLTDIIREPDLTAVLCVFTEENISKPHKRKIKKDSKGYYILLDGHKTYFQKEHKQFNSNF